MDVPLVQAIKEYTAVLRRNHNEKQALRLAEYSAKSKVPKSLIGDQYEIQLNQTIINEYKELLQQINKTQ